MILNFFKGLLIGIGAIMPGLSGAVLMVIFGVYDRLMRFLGNIRKDFFKQMLYFAPFGVGGLAGIWLFSFVVSEAFQSRFESVFVSLFVGFVVGTIPSLLTEASAEGVHLRGKIVALTAAILVFTTMLIGKQTFVQVVPNFPIWVVSGVLVGLGFVVPGLSPSNFLMYFGLYEKMSTGVKNMDFSVLIPLVIGAILAVVATIRLVNWLLSKHYELIYFTIFGLVCGSSAALIPALILPSFGSTRLAGIGIAAPLLALFCILSFGIGFVLSIQFAKLDSRGKN